MTLESVASALLVGQGNNYFSGNYSASMYFAEQLHVSAHAHAIHVPGFSIFAFDGPTMHDLGHLL